MHSFLCYDIPSAVRVGGQIRGALSPIAVRVNRSDWVLPTSAVAGLDIDRWRSWGVSVHVVAFSEGEADKVVKLAKAQLAKEVGEILDRLNGYLTTARAKLDRAEATQSVEGVEEVARFKKRSFRKAKNLLRDAESAALMFGIQGDLSSVISSVRASIASREATTLAAAGMDPAAIRGLPPESIPASGTLYFNEAPATSSSARVGFQAY